MWQEIVTGAELERPAASLDAKQVEARLIAYASNEVIRASQEAGAGGYAYESEVSSWHLYVEQGRMSPDIRPSGPRPGDASMAELALAWVLRRPELASAIVGATRPEQVHANGKASGILLTPDTLAAIDKALGDAPVTEPTPAPFAQSGITHR
jgi:aryl-alcohol dehydrogenase-like predicted oxidoreductase